jgi:hypothetical protein
MYQLVVRIDNFSSHVRTTKGLIIHAEDTARIKNIYNVISSDFF